MSSEGEEHNGRGRSYVARMPVDDIHSLEICIYVSMAQLEVTMGKIKILVQRVDF